MSILSNDPTPKNLLLLAGFQQESFDSDIYYYRISGQRVGVRIHRWYPVWSSRPHHEYINCKLSWSDVKYSSNEKLVECPPDTTEEWRLEECRRVILDMSDGMIDIWNLKSWES